MRYSQIEDVLDRFEWVRPGGGEWRAKCPAHKTHHRSLVISLGEKRMLFHCYAGCGADDILAAVGLNWQDIIYTNDPMPLSSRKPIVRPTDKRPWMSREEIEYQHDYGTMTDAEHSDRLLSWQGRRTLIEFDDAGEVTRYHLLRYEQEAVTAG